MTLPIRQAAGYFLYRDHEDGRQWLLLRNSLHKTWGFPKGHRDPEDRDLHACARRELKEETGLAAIDVHPHFVEVHDYTVNHPKRGPYDKKVSYFLARLNEGEVTRSDEHDDARWLKLKDALDVLDWDDLREGLRRAAATLEKGDS